MSAQPSDLINCVLILEVSDLIFENCILSFEFFAEKSIGNCDVVFNIDVAY
jgi:hypothetical protein